MPARPLQSLKFEPRRLEQHDPPRGGCPGNYQRGQNVSALSETRCFRCYKQGHVRRDSRMKIERAQFSKEAQTLPLENPWIRKEKINGRKASLWLDTGYTRSLVLPRCISCEQCLSWEICYSTTNTRKVWFPAARVTLQVGKTKQVLTVGMSPHLTVDMLIGRDVPQLTNPVEIEENPEDPPALAQVTTRAQRKRQDQKKQQDLEQQDFEQVKLSSPDLDPCGDESTSTMQLNLPRPLEQLPTQEGKLMELWSPPPQALEENEGFPFTFSIEMFTKEQPEPREETERPHPMVGRKSEPGGAEGDATV